MSVLACQFIQIHSQMKKLLVVVAVMVAVIAAQAQDKRWNVGVGGGVAFPAGDASDFTQTGFNGFVNGTFSIVPNFAAGMELSYVSLPGKTVGGIDLEKTRVSAIVIKGIYTFTQEGMQPYVALCTGLYSSRISVSLNLGGLGHISGSASDNNYGYGIEAGIRFNRFQVGAAYHVAASDFKYVLVGIGYTYTF